MIVRAVGRVKVLSATKTDSWAAQAKCRGTEDYLFAESAEQKRVRFICQACPVRNECLAEALDNRIEWGVWGGMTERERRQLLRQRADVTSWSNLLCRQRTGLVPDSVNTFQPA